LHTLQRIEKELEEEMEEERELTDEESRVIHRIRKKVAEIIGKIKKS